MGRLASVVVGTLLLAGRVSLGGFIVSEAAGGLYSAALGPPGTAFSISYNSIIQSYGTPLQLVNLTLVAQASGIGAPTALHIRLGADPDVTYDFAPLAPAQFYCDLYDPAWFSVPTLPNRQLDSVWKAELADGVFSGTFWFDGGAGSGVGHLGPQAWFYIPEPATAALLALGAACMVQRRSRAGGCVVSRSPRSPAARG